MVIVLLGIATAAINIGQAQLIARAMVAIFDGARLDDAVVFLIAAAILLTLRAIAAGQSENLGTLAANRIKQTLRHEIFHKVLDLGPVWLERKRSGMIQTVMVENLEMIQVYFSQLVPKAVISIFSVIALPAYVIVLDPLVGVTVAVSALIAICIPAWSNYFLRDKTRFWWDRYYPLNAEYLDHLQGMATLKSFNVSAPKGKALKEKAIRVRDAAIDLVKIVSVYHGGIDFVVAVGSSAAVGLGAFKTATGTLSVPELLLILLLVGQCFAPVDAMKRALHYTYYIPTVGSAIFDVLDARPMVKSAAEPVATDAVLKNPPAIAFRDVTFRYASADPPALEQVSFSVNPGETVGIVGRSGAGKTTIVSLLLRFFDPQQGSISIGDIDVRQITLTDLRQRIAVVSQNVYLFNGTILDNLHLAKPDANMAEIEKATRAAGAHDFIGATPLGYRTLVGDGGLKLSGGERQRIAIARALLKDAPILILDEATSSVDMANESAIQGALEEVRRHRTTIIIAHRLNTVRAADRILLFDQGRLIEDGDHDGLLEKDGIYAHLAALQGETA